MRADDQAMNLLAASRATLTRVAIDIPGYEKPLPFRLDLRTLWAKQLELEADVGRRIAEQRRAPQLGAFWIPIMIGAGVVATGIGGWIYKHYSDTKRVELRTEVYDQMIDDGLSPNDAADAIYGSGSEIGSVMNKLIVISIIGAGALLLYKFK